MTDLREGSSEMQFYICVRCGYTFPSPEVPITCPDCGKKLVRMATADETVKKLAVQMEEDLYLKDHPYEIS